MLVGHFLSLSWQYCVDFSLLPLQLLVDFWREKNSAVQINPLNKLWEIFEQPPPILQPIYFSKEYLFTQIHKTKQLNGQMYTKKMK